MNTRYAQAAPPRGREGIAVYQRIEGALARLAEKMGAAPMQYPVLIARDALVRAGYPDAFAHLLMMGANLRSPELIGEGQLEPGNLASPQWCLSPAVCYHVYAGFTGQTLGGPRVVTAGGRCFRHEATVDAGRRQIEFEMREIVLLGAADWVRGTAQAGSERLGMIAREFALAGQWRAAEDPFFLPRAQGQALMQRLKETKLEYCLEGDAEELALASVNFHGDFFGKRFDIRDADGNFIHTACIAAGIDRWASCIQRHRKEATSCHS